MNKTTIISFIIDKVALKLRNVSSNMRKRVAMLLEDKEIVVKEYDSRLLILNGWVKATWEAYGMPNIESINEIEKGVSDYVIEQQQELDKIISVNDEFKCQGLLFKPNKPLVCKVIDDLRVDQKSYKYYSDCSFQRVKYLVLKNLSFSQINSFLSKIKFIFSLRIEQTTLPKFDLRQVKIKGINFEFVTFKDKVSLPSSLRNLTLRDCKNISQVEPNKIKIVELICKNEEPMKSQISFIKKLRSVKCFWINSTFLFSEFFKFIPSTLRTLNFVKNFDIENVDPTELKAHFPYIIKINKRIRVELAQTLRLRDIQPIIAETKTKFTLRPRTIEIMGYNAAEINNHPELLEKVKKIEIFDDRFNFDHLPKALKAVTVNKASVEG